MRLLIILEQIAIMMYLYKIIIKTATLEKQTFTTTYWGWIIGVELLG